MAREATRVTSRKTLMVAGGLSLLAHVTALAGLAGEGPGPDLTSLDGAMTVVPVQEAPLRKSADPDPPAGRAMPSPAIETATRTPAHGPRQRGRRPAPPPTPPVDDCGTLKGFRTSRDGAPAAQPPAPHAPSAPVQPPAEQAEEEPAPPAPPPPAPPPPTMIPVALRTGPAPAEHPPRPAYLDPGVAQGLRITDSFPNLPEPLRLRGARHLVIAEICVSVTGAVTDVRIASQPVARPLVEALNAALLTWRYRPWLVDGVATPFCHAVRIAYNFH
jgi:protein TonB